jgi:hypothetical protein
MWPRGGGHIERLLVSPLEVFQCPSLESAYSTCLNCFRRLRWLRTAVGRTAVWRTLLLLEGVRRVNPRASTVSAPPRPWLPKIDLLPAVGRIEITVRFLRINHCLGG